MSALRKIDPEQMLAAEVMGFTHDPLGFVLYAYPWGVKGTPLENEAGPREWQAAVLNDIGAGLRAGMETDEAIRIAVASGHGIGKSALIAWIAHWGLSTCIDTKITLTANTEPQLRTKTWPEISKWFSMLICKHWFKLTQTAIFSLRAGHDETWRMDRVTWSEHNTDPFAGLHNKSRRIVLLFDEASAIADGVWEVAEGALTDEQTEIIWIAFGNPTKNTGRFKECFGKFGHRWIGRQIDSRTVPGTNAKLHKQWLEDWGEDTDFFRVRVRGLFPKASADQFISEGLVGEARRRTAEGYRDQPRILGVDVARFGDDISVLLERQGQRVTILATYSGLDTMQLAARVYEQMDREKYDAVFIDGVGVGGGVVDRLRQLNREVFDVNFGSKANDDAKFMNKRAEAYSDTRDWLKAGGCLPDDQALADELSAPEYYFDKYNRLALESKDDMKARLGKVSAEGGGSPDKADALALTFAERVVKGKNIVDDKMRAKLRGYAR